MFTIHHVLVFISYLCARNAQCLARITKNDMEIQRYNRLKAAIERVQNEACFNFIEREQARPQVKPERDFDKEPYTMDEVVRRLSPHGDRAGEWYCTSRQRKIAWRIDMVDAEGLIVRKLVHDMREHTISKAPEIYKPETVEQLARKIIDYNFRFLADFDLKEWD